MIGTPDAAAPASLKRDGQGEVAHGVVRGGGEPAVPLIHWVARVYQLELLSMAKERNVVAFLDTGSGKTFISVLLLKHRLEEHARRAQHAREEGGEAPRRWLAVFLAPKVALVQQQAEVLRRSLPVRVCSFIGAEVDAWWRDPKRWDAELANVDLAVMTPQILCDLLQHGILPSIACLDVICFDEAHHCTGRHPYAMIMGFYHATQGRRPRIFGMSAAPVSSGKKQSTAKLRQNITALEAALDARIVTVVDRAPVEAVASPPALNVVVYPPATWPSQVKALEQRLTHAHERVALAVANTEVQWRHGLQDAVGFDGISPGADLVVFDPGAPAFRASKLRDSLGAVLHVLQNLGPYCGAVCALHVMTWLVSGGLEGERCYGPSAAQATATGPFRTEVAQRSREVMAKLRESAFSWGEVSDDQLAANASSGDVLHAFADFLCPLPSRPPALAAALAALDKSLAARRPLRSLPVEILKQAIGSVQPAALQRSAEHACLPDAAASPGAEAGAESAVPGALLSPKAAVLLRELQRYRQAAEQGNWTAIVFVQQRMTALALHALLAAAPCTSCWVRSSPFMAQGASMAGHTFEPKEQADILRRFHQGSINMLVSTAVAEEGIDVRSCQLAARFDLPPNAQSYLQSRGRARQRDSDLLVLVDASDPEQHALVARMASYEAHLREQALANVEVLQDEGEGSEDEDEDEGAAAVEGEGGADGEGGQSDLEYRVAATGARVTLHTSLALLQRYTSKLPGDRFMVLRPVYRIEVLPCGRSLAQVQLPSASPVLTARGRAVGGTRQRAKASAALEALRQLHLAGALNDFLLPAAYEDEDKALARVANDKLHCMVLEPVQPALLSREIRTPEGQDSAVLYCYVWRGVAQREGGQPAGGPQAIGLLLPEELPDVAQLPAFHLEDGSLAELVHVGRESARGPRLERLLECSAILRRHAGGHCALSSASHTYVLAPLLDAHVAAAHHASEHAAGWAIDWQAVEEMCGFAEAAAAGNTVLDVIGRFGPGCLRGKILVTPYNRMQYLYRRVAEGVDLRSTFECRARGGGQGGQGGQGGPADAAAAPKGPTTTYADYYRARWGKVGLDPGQPMLHATRTTGAAHLRQPSGAAEGAEERGDDDDVYLVPELCAVHPIPAALWPVVAGARSVLWQLEGVLAAQELLQELRELWEGGREGEGGGAAPPAAGPAEFRPPPVGMVRCAITARSALDAAGDYENLETLGDGFLKYAVSAQLYTQNSQYHEGQLTAAKMRVISNSRLLAVAMQLGLDRRVRVAPMTKEAGPEGSPAGVEEGESTDWGHGARNLKVLADSVEALIGAFWAGAGEASAMCLLRRLGLLRPFRVPTRQELAAEHGPAARLDLSAVEDVLGYKFGVAWLAQEALTHGSCLTSRCYQRLEFLGDAVLDAGLTQHYYAQGRLCTPGFLHNVRSAGVNSERLALAAVRHGLQAHIRHQSPALFRLVDDFTAEVHRRVGELEVEVAGERRGGGACGSLRDAAWARLLCDNSFGLDTAVAPKVLSDVMEALIGAVWVDSGGSLEAAWRAAFRLLRPLPAIGDEIPLNPLRRLRELAAKTGMALQFQDISAQCDASGGGVVIRVLGDGVNLGQGLPAHNRTTASRLAAQAVLAAWDAPGGRGEGSSKRGRVSR